MYAGAPGPFPILCPCGFTYLPPNLLPVVQHAPGCPAKLSDAEYNYNSEGFEEFHTSQQSFYRRCHTDDESEQDINGVESGGSANWHWRRGDGERVVDEGFRHVWGHWKPE
jgi:hypothetical protein